MALNKHEKFLVEAIDTLLSQKAQLGVPDPPKNQQKQVEHSFQYLHEEINNRFAIKATDLVHHDGICAAFAKVHSYKYVTDPTFHEAMERELRAQGIPAEERTKALGFIPDVIEEVKDSTQDWDEKDSGFHPDLNEIMKVSRPG